MKLLLFLSALLTGFTGAISGERGTAAPAVQQSVARAMEIVAEAVAQMPIRARHAVATVRSPILSERIARPCWQPQTAAPGRNAGLVNEKRLV